MLQLMAEVTIPRSRSRRDDRNALRQQRHFQFFVQRQHSFFCKLPEYFPAPACHIPQCIGRIDVLHSQTVTVQFMESNGHFNQHLNAGSKRLPGGFFEIGLQQPVDIGPDRSPRFGYQIIAAGIFLDKLQIAMSRTVCTDIAQLRLYPVFIGQALFQAPPDQSIQFVKRKGVLHTLFFLRSRLIGLPQIGHSVSIDVIGEIHPVAGLTHQFDDFLSSQLRTSLPQASHHAAQDR